MVVPKVAGVALATPTWKAAEPKRAVVTNARPALVRLNIFIQILLKRAKLPSVGLVIRSLEEDALR